LGADRAVSAFSAKRRQASRRAAPIGRRAAIECRRPGAERRRQGRLDLRPQALAQHRGGAAGADRDDYRRAVDDGAEADIGELGPVDDIDRHTPLPGCGGERLRILPAERADRQRNPAKVIPAPGACEDRHAAGGRRRTQLPKIGVGMGGEHGDARARRRRQLGLPQRRFAIAGNDNALVLEIGEHRQQR
jgi:hypothetical protein